MKILKWLGIFVGALVVVILLAVGYIYMASGKVINKDYSDIPKGKPLYARADSATLAWGTHLGTVLAMCTECHGDDAGGTVFVDDPAFGTLSVPNISGGKGSVVPADFDIADFERIVRHGIKPDNKGALLMPSYHYCYMSDEDMAALWVWFKSLKPVDKETPPIRYGPVARMLIAQDKFPKLSPDMVNHQASRPAKPPAGETAEYGQYLAHLSCVGCHGMDLSGGPIEGAPPDWPPATNLTSGGTFAKYTEQDFFNALREGVRPGGEALSEIMPFKRTTDMTDAEIRALWLYLKTLPAKPVGSFVWRDEKRP